jgi:hypothetical protein
VKLTSALFTAGFVLASTPAFAAEPPVVQGFTDLPSTGTLRVYGSANINVDPFYIAHGAPTGGTGVPFTDPFTFDLPTNFSLIDSRRTVFSLPITETDLATGLPVTAIEEVGAFYDAVFRDLNDNRLVFGSRIVMDPTEEGEINDIFRFGAWTGNEQVGWTFVTSDDLRLFSAARTLNSNINDDTLDTFYAGVIGLATDVNVEEGHPVTGWFFIKTDAPDFVLLDNAIGLFQAGEEGQPPFQAQLTGFAPVPVPAAVWLLGSALVGMAGVARRRA